MAKFVFKGNVLHNGESYQSGHICPDSVLPFMQKLGVVRELEEAKAPEAPKPQAPKQEAPKHEAPKAEKK